MGKISGTKILVIGGGTGSFVVLSGLKRYARDISALVNMADDGGSTGQLRDEYGVLPSGDVRQCLVALSSSPRVRELFNYRFDEGRFAGHAFGNLFLTALEKMTGSFAEGVKLAEQVLRVDGEVIPVTLDSATLVAKDGRRVIRGEDVLTESKLTARHPRITVEKRDGRGRVHLNPAAAEAIKTADMIVIAPGNLYSSLAPSLAISGMGKLLMSAPAKKVYITNLINKPGQTDGFAVHNYAAELERIAGAKFLDYVIYNIKQPSDELLEKYAKAGELPVAIDQEALREAHYKVIGAKLLADQVWQNKSKKDPLAAQRSLIRHDPDAVARSIMKLFFS